jgi:hypothetical protein
MKSLRESLHNFTHKNKSPTPTPTIESDSPRDSSKKVEMTSSTEEGSFKEKVTKPRRRTLTLSSSDDSEFYPLIVYYCNDPIDIDLTFLHNHKKWILLKRRVFKDNILATLGRAYLCLLISDLLVFNINIDMFSDFVDGALYSMADTQDSQIVAVNAVKSESEEIVLGSNWLFKKTKKDFEKCSKWIEKNYKKLWKKTFKVKKNNEMLRISIRVYLRGYMDTDSEIKTLYFTQPRVRSFMDSLSQGMMNDV